MSVQKLLSGKGTFVSVVKPNFSIRDAMAQLNSDEVPAVVVTSNEEDILGIITEKEVVNGLKRYGEDIMNQPVSKIMLTDIVTCDVEEPLHKIYELMDTHQLNYVPILRRNKLCGIINILDVIKYRLGEMNREADLLRSYISGVAA